MNSIMKFILYSSKKSFGHITSWVIINGGSINVRYLLIEISLAASNVPDSRERAVSVKQLHSSELSLQILLQFFRTFAK